MATWSDIYTGSAPGNISMIVGFGYGNVSRNGNNVSFNFGLSFRQSYSTYTYNSVTGWYGGNRKYACASSGSTHTSNGVTYYATTSTKVNGSYYTGETLCWYWSGTVNTYATSVALTVGAAWDAWTPSGAKTSWTVYVPIPASCRVSISQNTKSHNSITLNYGYTGAPPSQVDVYNGGTYLGSYYSSPFTISNLSPKTTYSNIYAYGYNASSGWGPASNSLSITTYPSPVTVSSVNVSNIQPFSCDLSMSVSSTTDTNATEYSIYASNGTTLVLGPYIDSSGALFKSIAGLNPETSYIAKFRVQTKNSLVWSSYSTASFTTISDQSQGWVKYGGIWHKGKAFIKHGGIWSPAKKTFVKVSGTWRNTTNN